MMLELLGHVDGASFLLGLGSGVIAGALFLYVIAFAFVAAGPRK